MSESPVSVSVDDDHDDRGSEAGPPSVSDTSVSIDEEYDGSDYDGSDGSDPEVELPSISDTIAATVKAITDYYDFISKMYLDPAVIITPPEDGWPEITNELMREMGKTDEVAELLRRLPYIRPAAGNEHHYIYAASYCKLANWVDIIAPKSKELSLIPFADRVDGMLHTTECGTEHVPAHVVGLTNSRDFQLFLDTRHGVVYFYGSHFGPGPRRWAMHNRNITPFPPMIEPDEDAVEGAEWADLTEDDTRWNIPDFFELMKFHFRELHLIPFNQREAYEDFDRDRPVEERFGLHDFPGIHFPRVREIFQEHGWPDLTRYDKEKCIEAVEEVTKERSTDVMQQTPYTT